MTHLKTKEYIKELEEQLFKSSKEIDRLRKKIKEPNPKVVYLERLPITKRVVGDILRKPKKKKATKKKSQSIHYWDWKKGKFKCYYCEEGTLICSNCS